MECGGRSFAKQLAGLLECQKFFHGAIDLTPTFVRFSALLEVR
jgi:hypothetical protein